LIGSTARSAPMGSRRFPLAAPKRPFWLGCANGETAAERCKAGRYKRLASGTADPDGRHPGRIGAGAAWEIFAARRYGGGSRVRPRVAQGTWRSEVAGDRDVR